jgi:hypothetical protein
MTPLTVTVCVYQETVVRGITSLEGKTLIWYWNSPHEPDLLFFVMPIRMIKPF